MKPARADILDRFVDLGGEFGERVDAVLGEVEDDALGVEQRLVLADQAVFRFAQDAPEILAGQRLELDADRQPSLQFRQQVGRLGEVSDSSASSTV